MKEFRYFISALIVGFVPLAMINCEELPAGLVTTVEGEVRDSVKQKPLVGAKVLLIPCYFTYGSVPRVCAEAIDSARTDTSGKYKMEFTTDGKTDVYLVTVVRDELFLALDSEEVNPGEVNLITLYGRELNHLKVEVEIHDNPIGEITIRAAATNNRIIKQTTRDTIIYTTFLPLEVNTVSFRVRAPNTGGKYRVNVDTFYISTTDTTYLKKVIETPLDWPIWP